MKITEQQASELSFKVHEALGAASVCGDPVHIEMSEIELLLEIGVDLMREIMEILGLEVDQP